MKQRIRQVTSRGVDRLASQLEARWVSGRGLPVRAIANEDGRRLGAMHRGLSKRVDGVTKRVDGLAKRNDRLTKRIDVLEAEVTECRRLNQRLSDVIDVVTEVLVPSMDRDDARLKVALGRLNAAGVVDPVTADDDGAGWHHADTDDQR